MKKEVRKNNKGFSLVELIVVVAIMAVLMVVLAPAMLRYVEKTRKQKDDSAAGEVREALELALADNDVYEAVNTELAGGKVFYVTIDNAGKVALDGLDSSKDGGKAVLAEIKNTVGTVDGTASGATGIKLSSKARQDSNSKCWIKASYDDTRQAFVVRYIDNSGETSDKIAWDGKKATTP